MPAAAPAWLRLILAFGSLALLVVSVKWPVGWRLPAFKPLTLGRSADRVLARCQPRDGVGRLAATQMQALIALPQGSPQSRVQGLLGAPLCTLPVLIVRVGKPTTRWVYQLEPPDQQGEWIVVLFEDNVYLAFAFQQDQP